MPSHSSSPSPRRFLKSLKVIALFLFLGLACGWTWLRQPPRAGSSEIDRSAAVRPDSADLAVEVALPETVPGLAAARRAFLAALAKDGRTLEPGSAVVATALASGPPLQLALDEAASFGEKGGMGFHRMSPQKNRTELEKAMVAARAAGAPPYYPVLYVKNAKRVPANRRVVTGEIVAALNPGISAEEIARDYNLNAMPAGASMVGLSRFVARSGFKAMELVSKLRLDARVAIADHDLVKMIAPKAFVPNDPLFNDQWALLPVSPSPPGDIWHLNVLPLLDPPVWGDFDSETDGIRGRGVRVGIVDDGLQFAHPDFAGRLSSGFDHHGYDLVAQRPTVEQPNPPPQVVPSNGPQAAEPLKTVNLAHGILMAGVIGASTNNGIGVAGTAPACEMVGIRALSWYYDSVNQIPPQPPALTYSNPDPTDAVSPMTDALIAAAFEYLMNENHGRDFNGRTIFPGTVFRNVLPTFSDVAQGPMIHVKACGWGAPDAGNIEGPGPEVAGYTQNFVYFPGARYKAVTEGRRGLGSVIVHPSGNGRFRVLENANNDGYANAREVICVAGLARIAATHFDNTGVDHSNLHSEPGACVMVSAPCGGSYLSAKRARTNNGQPPGGTVTTLTDVVTNIATTDWNINEPGDPNADPPRADVFGINGPDTQGDYSNRAYTRLFTGTSAACAYVSGVVALMLEANPRLSWMDVQHILIRTARNHLDPLAYALDPTATPGVLNALDGLDIADPEDVVPLDHDWRKNGAHVWFNHKYGAGLVDARRAVDSALLGILIPAQLDHQRVDSFTSTTYDIANPLPTAPAGTPGTVTEIPFSPLAPTDYAITHVTVRFDKIETTAIGGLGITLVSPSGMESTLLEPRIDFADELANWEFNSLRYWGEDGKGTWRLRIADYAGSSSVINPQPGPGESTPRVTLSLFGYVKPLLPDITKPASADANAPTIVGVPLGKGFNYTMNASNNPTTWYLEHPDPLATGPVLPPGLALTDITPEAATTYLPDRVVTGNTNVPVGSCYDVKVTAANITGFSVPKYVRFVVIPPDPPTDPYTQWANFYWLPFAWCVPAANGSADAEADGGVNVAEFALGTSPVAGDFWTATSVSPDGTGKWNFSFHRFPTRGVKYEFQVSDSLATDSWVTMVVSDPAVADGVPASGDPAFSVSEGPIIPAGPEPQSERRLITVTTGPGGPADLYFRLKLTPPRSPLNPQ